MNSVDIQDLEFKSILYRKTILSIIKHANAGHTAGSLSCVDILNVLYNYVMDIHPDNFVDTQRDRYIHSKGHSVEALYAVLQDKGFFRKEELKTLNQYQSHFVGHPTRKVMGIEHNSGALGHGLSVAVGLALAFKKDDLPYRVYTLLGDGELEEGSNWEASMSAAHYQLDNLVVVIDRNTLQITGRTEDVTHLEPLTEKFKAFGYAVANVDGHSVVDLIRIFREVPFIKEKPSLILAETVKGKGISFIEDTAEWHHHVPSDEEFEAAMLELDLAETNWKMANELG
jgi:transketolase